MIIGAGQMGEALRASSGKEGARDRLWFPIVSFDRAVDLANEFGGRGSAV